MLRWSRASNLVKVGVLVAIGAVCVVGCQRQDVTAKKPPAKPVVVDLDSPADAAARSTAEPTTPALPSKSPSATDQLPAVSPAAPPSPEPSPGATGHAAPGSSQTPIRPIEAPTAAPITSRIGNSAAMPKVVLTAPMKADCVVGVGDRMPDGPLRDASGKLVSLESLRGKNATVIFLFGPAKTNEGRALVVSALEDLAAEVATPWSGKGVAIVAVGVAAASDEVQALRSKAKYPILDDPAGAYFALVAKSQLPRVYLVDGTGHIVWFDIEFSRTTRRDLLRALTALAGNSP